METTDAVAAVRLRRLKALRQRDEMLSWIQSFDPKHTPVSTVGDWVERYKFYDELANELAYIAQTIEKGN